MKKLRRIVITAFRRRTTIILRDKPEGDPIEPPPRHGDAAHTAPARPPQAEGDDPNPSGHAASAGQLEIPEPKGDASEKASRAAVVKTGATTGFTNA